MSERRLFTYYKTLIIITCLIYEVSSNDKSKNHTIFSRLSVEEIDNNTLSQNVTDFKQDYLVSLMVKNVKNIFGSEDEIAVDSDVSNVTPIIMFTVSSTVDDSNDTISESSDFSVQTDSMDTTVEVIQKDLNVLSSNNNTESDENSETEDEPKFNQTRPELKRSCIFCDNVGSINCVNPKTKLVQTTDCNLADDLCYSMHTPFGVVERGCYNVNHNLTTYVCACNLCNHIPIGELPYIFSYRRDWIDNVIELTRVKRLRQSILKEMACLKCEVNATAYPKHLRGGSYYCYEGKIGSIPTQECQEDEICGIKSIKSEGYIWRGCLKSPLYNYWWRFCDSNLCNHDALASIYDPV